MKTMRILFPLFFSIIAGADVEFTFSNGLSARLYFESGQYVYRPCIGNASARDCEMPKGKKPVEVKEEAFVQGVEQEIGMPEPVPAEELQKITAELETLRLSKERGKKRVNYAIDSLEERQSYYLQKIAKRASLQPRLLEIKAQVTRNKVESISSEHENFNTLINTMNSKRCSKGNC